MSNEWPLDKKNEPDTIPDLEALDDTSDTLVDAPKFVMTSESTSLTTPKLLRDSSRQQFMYLTVPHVDNNNRTGGRQSRNVLIMPKLTPLNPHKIQEQTRSAVSSVERSSSSSKILLYFLSVALASGTLLKYLDLSLVNTQKESAAIIYTPEQNNIQNTTNNTLTVTQTTLTETVDKAPTVDLVPQTFQDHQLKPVDTSVELAAQFTEDFESLKQIIRDLDIRQRVAYENFNDETFSNKLIHIARNYNREQKMQVYDYLEGLSIIPSSAKEIMQRNTSALVKIYDYLRDFNAESNIERQERVKQRAYSLLLRAVVERAPLEELTFIINSFNPSSRLSNNSSYIDVIEAIGNDSQYNLDADRIMSIEPFESNGLYKDVEFFRDTYSQIIPHADILTARTVTATGIHETAPRFTQVENQEQANMLLLELYDYTPWNIVRFENGILTLGPTQLQDWNILFDRFPQAIQDKVIALGANIGIEVTDLISAMRAAVLSPEIQFLLSTSLMSVNYETLYNNIPEFRTASIATQRRALILSNKIGAGSKGIQVIRQMIKNNSWDSHGYIKSTYNYISLLQTIFR